MPQWLVIQMVIHFCKWLLYSIYKLLHILIYAWILGLYVLSWYSLSTVLFIPKLLYYERNNIANVLTSKKYQALNYKIQTNKATNFTNQITKKWILKIDNGGHS